MFSLNPKDGNVIYVGFILAIEEGAKQWYVTCGEEEQSVKEEMAMEPGFNAEKSFIVKVNLPNVDNVKGIESIRTMDVNMEEKVEQPH